MTHTSTKTAVAWMLVGGIAALAASMALGLPWQNYQQNVNTPTPVKDADSKPAILNQLWQIDCIRSDNTTLRPLKVIKSDKVATEDDVKETWQYNEQKDICDKIKGAKLQITLKGD